MPAEIDDTIAVIGGGIAGCQVALLARRAGFGRVLLLERRPSLVLGSTAAATKIHLGAAYPWSWPTAVDCLKGAMAIQQMLPSGVWSRSERLALLVTRESEQDSHEGVTQGALFAHVARLREEYSRIAMVTATSLGRSVKEVLRESFGPPGAIYEPVPRGVLGAERMIDWERLNGTFAAALRRSGVEVRTGTRAVRLRARGDAHEIELDGGPPVRTGQIVVASHEGSWGLHPDVAPLFAEARALVWLDTSKVDRALRGRPLFMMAGPSGGAYVPAGEDRALLYIPRPSVSYLGRAAPGRSIASTRSLPSMERSARIERALDAAVRGPFPFLDRAAPLDLLVRVALRGEDRRERMHLEAREVRPGMVIAVATKATYSTRLALQALRLLLARSVARGRVSSAVARRILGPAASHDWVVPEHLRAQDIDVPRSTGPSRVAERVG